MGSDGVTRQYPKLDGTNQSHPVLTERRPVANGESLEDVCCAFGYGIYREFVGDGS